MPFATGPALGALCAFGSSVTWAVGSAGYSRLSRTYTPFAVNFARALVALPLFVAAAFLSSGGWQAGLEAYAMLRPAHLTWFLASMIASYGLGDALFLLSTRSLGVPGALAIASCYPLLTAAAGVLFQGERLVPLQILGLLLSVGGVVVVILNTQGPGGPERAGSKGRGVALAVLAGCFWALNSYSVARLGKDLNPAVGNTIRMLLALGLSAGFGAALARGESILIPPRTIASSFWLFAFEAFGGSYVFMYGLGHSPLSLGSTLSSLAPVISVPVAWALGLEKFSLFRTLGVCSVVLGLALLVSGFST